MDWFALNIIILLPFYTLVTPALRLNMINVSRFFLDTVPEQEKDARKIVNQVTILLYN